MLDYELSTEFVSDTLEILETRMRNDVLWRRRRTKHSDLRAGPKVAQDNAQKANMAVCYETCHGVPWIDGKNCVVYLIVVSCVDTVREVASANLLIVSPETWGRFHPNPFLATVPSRHRY